MLLFNFFLSFFFFFQFLNMYVININGRGVAKEDRTVIGGSTTIAANSHTHTRAYIVVCRCVNQTAVYTW